MHKIVEADTAADVDEDEEEENKKPQQQQSKTEKEIFKNLSDKKNFKNF